MAKLSYTAAEIDALLGKVATHGDDVEAIIAAFPFVLQRGEYTLNDQSELTFDTLSETKYYRYTGSAIGNPVSGGYGIVINIRFTAYAVQIMISQTTASAPTRLLYRLGKDMSTTPKWMAWQTVSTGSGGGGATIDTLWSDSNGATVGTTYTMAGNINDYDVIYVSISTVPDITNLGVYTQTSFLPSLIGATGKISFQGLYDTRVVVADFSAGSSFTVISNDAETSNQKPTIYGIVGIKY